MTRPKQAGWRDGAKKWLRETGIANHILDPPRSVHQSRQGTGL